jgi:hypothetical protein
MVRFSPALRWSIIFTSHANATRDAMDLNKAILSGSKIRLEYTLK